MACPDTITHRFPQGVVGPETGSLPTTDSGARVELIPNVVNASDDPPFTNLAWTVAGEPGSRGRGTAMHQHVGDVIEIDGLCLQVCSIDGDAVVLGEL